jgi:hypothetical protein
LIGDEASAEDIEAFMHEISERASLIYSKYGSKLEHIYNQDVI